METADGRIVRVCVCVRTAFLFFETRVRYCAADNEVPRAKCDEALAFFFFFSNGDGTRKGDGTRGPCFRVHRKPRMNYVNEFLNELPFTPVRSRKGIDSYSHL